MAIYTTLNELFTGIANAIRTKNNTTELIMASNFPAEIASLRTGFNYNNQNTTSIADYQFYECEDLKSLDCPNLTSVGTSAFENCTNLKSVILYNNIESIGDNAFEGCNNLNKIYVAWAEGERDGAPWGADNAMIYYQSVGSIGLQYTLKSDNTYEAEMGICTDTNIVIPKYHNSLPVTSIGKYAFSDCTSLTSINIPDSVTSIGDSAFSDCTSLASIIIPNGVTSISNEAFYGCKSLTSIDIPDSITSIGIIAFSDCTSLTSINIPNSVTSIGGGAFGNCTSLTSINIPNSVTSIGEGAFSNCNNLTRNVYDNAYYIGNNNNPYLVLLKAKNKDISSCNIHKDTRFIGFEAFYGFSYNGVGYSCSNLTSITIPNGVIDIGDRAFANCYNLTSINYTGTVTQWKAITFGDRWNYNTGNGNYTIHCTDGDLAKDGTILGGGQ